MAVLHRSAWADTAQQNSNGLCKARSAREGSALAFSIPIERRPRSGPTALQAGPESAADRVAVGAAKTGYSLETFLRFFFLSTPRDPIV